MNHDLKLFVFQWLGAAFGALWAVILVAFFTMPLALGFHPGEAGDRMATNSMHMT